MVAERGGLDFNWAIVAEQLGNERVGLFALAAAGLLGLAYTNRAMLLLVGGWVAANLALLLVHVPLHERLRELADVAGEATLDQWRVLPGEDEDAGHGGAGSLRAEGAAKPCQPGRVARGANTGETAQGSSRGDRLSSGARFRSARSGGLAAWMASSIARP